SAVEKEGKTTLSCHLAASLARAGRKTLLIDGDLRKPTLHRLFNLSSPVGFHEVLDGSIDFTAAVQSTPLPGLFVLTSGTPHGVLIRELAGKNLSGIFSRMKSHFDFIIVDTPPLFPVADAFFIGQHVDAAL